MEQKDLVKIDDLIEDSIKFTSGNEYFTELAKLIIPGYALDSSRHKM